MNQKKTWLVLVLAVSLLAGCTQNQAAPDQQDTRQEASQGQLSSKQAKQSSEQRKQTQAQEKKQATPDLAGGPERKVREPHPMTLADLHNKYPSTFRLSGTSTKRQVALTFDDGPDAQFTPQILDVLKKYNVKATFFLVGKRVDAHPEIVKRMIREGHELGNHSYSHANLPKLKDEAFRNEVLRTQRAIAKISGYQPQLIRPPYGEINEEQIKWLASQGFTMVNWNVDSLDWKGLKGDQVADNVLSNITPGAIILHHSAGGEGEDLSGTIEALPKIIKKLKADGVSFVTVSELLNIPKAKGNLPKGR